MRGRLLVLGLLGLVAVAAIWLSPDTEVVEPVWLEELRAEFFTLQASSITQRGGDRVFVVRFREQVDFVPYHFNHYEEAKPQPVDRWRALLGAPLVFNAGQFDEDLDYLGWLKSRGTWLSEHRKAAWMGLMVSRPTDGAHWAGVIDLQRNSPEIADQYENVMQSMMLFDEEGALRVRDSDRTACRTVLGQDKAGRMLLIVTEGAVTLGDLARWLMGSNLDLTHAMNLDGGVESQFSIHTASHQQDFFGQYGTGASVFEGRVGSIRYPLPAVVAVYPRGSDAR